MRLSAIALTLILSQQLCLAADWSKEIAQLSSNKWSERETAQSSVITKIEQENNKVALEKNLDSLLETYQHEKDPEVRFRLLVIMRKISVLYKDSLGKSMVGINVKATTYKIDRRSYPAVLVSSILKGSPAEVAGIIKGDKITAVGSERITNTAGAVDDNFTTLIQRYAPGEEVQLEVVRGDSTQSFKVRLSHLVDSQQKRPSQFLSAILLGKKPSEAPKLNTPNIKGHQFDNLILPESFNNGSYFARWFKSKQLKK